MKLFGNKNKPEILKCIFFPLAIFYMEMLLLGYTCGVSMPWGIVYIFLFSFVIGFICVILSSIWGGAANKIVAFLLMAFLTLIFCVQAVYFTIFKTFTNLGSVSKAGEVLSDFGKQALAGIVDTIIPLLLLIIPLLLLIIFRKKLIFAKRTSFKRAIVLIVAAAVFQTAAIVSIRTNEDGVMSYEYVYYDAFAPELSVPRFGMLTTTRLDLMNMLGIGGSSDSQNAGENNADDERNDTPAAVVYEDNVLEINFDALIAEETNGDVKAMHEYFKNVTPTKQNEYTGMFKDYNLIWIVAEGFSSFALDETHTPTLCKLANEGFVFNNFYNPIWGVSTSDGEYTTTTGLIPKAGVWSYSKSSANYMPFGFGNMFSDIGYESRAYHNHTHTYYDRDKSHPNMGYDYKGVGNGLELEVKWPNSDMEMMQKTIPEYINSEKFHTYYMTVSGHLEYNFMGNSMCAKHKDEVADLPYSEAARAYIACQMEFDQSVKYLIDELTKAGKLENTVIVISGDHYPYGLEVAEMQELAGKELDGTFELYRSSLMIWNSEMERVEVDKYCSAIDIMPTLANLFGLEYDSRLVMGTDILSTSKPLVIFNDRSFITDIGRYSSGTDTFTLNEGETASPDYASKMLGVVSDKFKYSAKILENDYYAKVLNRE